jgi:hypothetical protein
MILAVGWVQVLITGLNKIWIKVTQNLTLHCKTGHRLSSQTPAHQQLFRFDLEPS